MDTKTHTIIIIGVTVTLALNCCFLLNWNIRHWGQSWKEGEVELKLGGGTITTGSPPNAWDTYKERNITTPCNALPLTSPEKPSTKPNSPHKTKHSTGYPTSLSHLAIILRDEGGLDVVQPALNVFNGAVELLLLTGLWQLGTWNWQHACQARHILSPLYRFSSRIFWQLWRGSGGVGGRGGGLGKWTDSLAPGTDKYAHTLSSAHFLFLVPFLKQKFLTALKGLKWTSDSRRGQGDSLALNTDDLKLKPCRSEFDSSSPHLLQTATNSTKDSNDPRSSQRWIRDPRSNQQLHACLTSHLCHGRLHHIQPPFSFLYRTDNFFFYLLVFEPMAKPTVAA